MRKGLGLTTRLSDIPPHVLAALLEVLETKYPPAEQLSDCLDEKDAQKLLFRAGQRSVVRDIQIIIAQQKEHRNG